MLAEQAGAHVHFRQLSTRASFDLIRQARTRGVRVSCGVSPAHLLLSDIAIGAFRTYARLSPPLRSEDDRLATIEAVRDGTVDLICSGHDPRGTDRSEEHTSELQSLMRISYAVFCLKKKKKKEQ